MDTTKEKRVRQILALFNLSDAQKNSEEAEVLSAVTKARQLMRDFNVTDADLAAYGTDKAKKIAILVREDSAYTLKRRSFAAYDNAIARTVDYICGTTNYSKTYFRGMDLYVSRQFIGADGDVAIAVALFQQLMETMKSLAKQQYGSRWSTPHSSYCLGFSTRLMQRAHEFKAKALPAAQENAVGLMLRDKHAAVEDFAKKLGLRAKKVRRQTVNRSEYEAGRIAAETIDLGDPRRRVK